MKGLIFICCKKTLNIPSSEQYDFLSENVDHPTLRDTVKWMNHPSIFTLVSKHNKIHE